MKNGAHENSRRISEAVPGLKGGLNGSTSSYPGPVEPDTEAAGRSRRTRRLRVSLPTFRITESTLRRINRSLDVLAVLMSLAGLGYLWHQSPALAELERVPSPELATIDQRPPVQAPTGADIQAVLARRQFFRTDKRQTFAAPALNVTDVPGLAERFTLLGIITGDVPQAIIRQGDARSSVFVSPGQRLGKYQVVEILPDRVVLESLGQRLELTM